MSKALGDPAESMAVGDPAESAVGQATGDTAIGMTDVCSTLGGAVGGSDIRLGEGLQSTPGKQATSSRNDGFLRAVTHYYKVMIVSWL